MLSSPDLLLVPIYCSIHSIPCGVCGDELLTVMFDASEQDRRAVLAPAVL